MKRQILQPVKPLTIAQKIYGKMFDNTPIVNERPAELRSDNPHYDKVLFQKYKAIRRQQTKIIRACRTGRIELNKRVEL